MNKVDDGGAVRRIGLGHLEISERARRYTHAVLDSNRLTYGTYTRRLEEAFAREHGCRHAIFCNSGTSALQVALACLKEQYDFSDGDEILVPAITFVATSNIVLQNQLTPVFVDVDPRTYNLDPAQIERRMTHRTRAIIPVHLCGLICDMDPILDIAKKKKLHVLEDSAQTMFVAYKGRPAGSMGDLACFSTYAAHLLVSGVGGLITTNDPKSAEICRSLIAHGRDSIYLSIDDDDNLDEDDRMAAMIERRFSFVRLGYSYRATEIEAAIALAQLEEREAMMQRRRQNAEYLLRHLKGFEDHLQLPYLPDDRGHAFMMFPLMATGDGVRTPLLMHLEARGIETRPFFPLLSQPVYQKLFGNLGAQYPVAQSIEQRGFYVGCHQGLTQEDLDYVIEAFTTFFERGSQASG